MVIDLNMLHQTKMDVLIHYWLQNICTIFISWSLKSVHPWNLTASTDLKFDITKPETSVWRVIYGHHQSKICSFCSLFTSWFSFINRFLRALRFAPVESHCSLSLLPVAKHPTVHCRGFTNILWLPLTDLFYGASRCVIANRKAAQLGEYLRCRYSAIRHDSWPPNNSIFVDCH